MSRDVYLVGVKMTRFGRYPDHDVIDLGYQASAGALDDAGLTMADMDVMAAGCLLQAGASVGQQIQKQLGQHGIPVFNVTNACATGATALRCVILSVLAGESEAGLAVGAEQMGKAGLLGGLPDGQPDEYVPTGRVGAVVNTEGVLGTNLMPALFSHAATDYLRKYPDVSEQAFAEIAVKNHANSVLNPLAMYQKAFSLEEILKAPMVTTPNTVLMCGPTCDGAAAAVVVSADLLERLPDETRRRAVRIRASVMTSDPWAPGEEESPDLNTLTALAAHRAYAAAGLGPEDLDLVELHDCFATAELLHYENLGLCEPGGAYDLLRSGATQRSGRIPVNASGGLLSKGHPLGATGLAGVYEVTTQLRGEAGERQLDRPSIGMTHVVGLGSSCVVNILEAPSAVSHREER